jgi:hypothetical protein
MKKRVIRFLPSQALQDPFDEMHIGTKTNENSFMEELLKD